MWRELIKYGLSSYRIWYSSRVGSAPPERDPELPHPMAQRVGVDPKPLGRAVGPIDLAAALIEHAADVLGHGTVQRGPGHRPALLGHEPVERERPLGSQQELALHGVSQLGHVARPGPGGQSLESPRGEPALPRAPALEEVSHQGRDVSGTLPERRHPQREGCDVLGQLRRHPRLLDGGHDRTNVYGQRSSGPGALHPAVLQEPHDPLLEPIGQRADTVEKQGAAVGPLDAAPLIPAAEELALQVGPRDLLTAHLEHRAPLPSGQPVQDPRRHALAAPRLALQADRAVLSRELPELLHQPAQAAVRSDEQVPGKRRQLVAQEPVVVGEPGALLEDRVVLQGVGQRQREGRLQALEQARVPVGKRLGAKEADQRKPMVEPQEQAQPTTPPMPQGVLEVVVHRALQAAGGHLWLQRDEAGPPPGRERREALHPAALVDGGLDLDPQRPQPGIVKGHGDLSIDVMSRSRDNI